MDRVRELPQAGQQRAEIPLELVEGLAGPRVAAAQAFPGHRQLRDAHHQDLLHAVVQVALDAAALGVLAGHDPSREAASWTACCRITRSRVVTRR
jgi:hypothetical protein